MNSDIEDFDLKSRLIDKSVEAYTLALETINRLTIQYRLETFCYLFCNAWELLLKAKIVSDSGNEDSIFYPKNPGEPRRSFSLTKCLNETMPNIKDPVRRNIERVAELRHESVHLVIRDIPSDLMRFFQSGVINYHKRLNEWFEESLSDRYPSLPMMSIVYDRSPDHWDMSSQRLQQRLGNDAFTFLSKYCADLRKELDELQQSPEFSIGIEYRLVLSKSPGHSDIMLSSGTTGNDPTQVVEVPKDPSRTHPLRQTEVLECTNAQIEGKDINRYDIQCVNEVYRIKTNAEYFYQGTVKGSPAQYSNAFVDFLANKYRNDPQFFEKTREKYKSSK